MTHPKLTPGRSLHGFLVRRTVELPELRSLGIDLEHERTGLKLFHITNDDDENAFAFTFRTPPRTSNGVAHILEHSVLCGSGDYPLKDPFFTLIKGSMSTYLNAWTFPDKTVYPAASTNRTDYFNIMHVYGDAVFFPLLRPETFLQEAHRLEPSAPGNQASTLVANGVVFSEMKGAYSSQSEIAGDWTFRSLFPDTPYGVDSGGEPAVILDLTYEELKAFHRAYYHPSNCRVLLYGDIPTADQLEFLQDRFLSRFDRLAVDSSLNLQKKWDAPRRLRKTYPVPAGEDIAKKTETTVSWLLGETADPHHRAACQTLSEILSGHPGSPLRRSLVESGLGQDYSSAAGLDNYRRQLAFSTGLRGMDEADAPRLEELALLTLRRLRDEGIPDRLKEGAFHRIEFRAREITGGNTPYPLTLFERALKGWLHDASPEETLRPLPALAALRKKMAAHPRHLEELVGEYFLDNPHRCLVVTAPDPGFMEKFEGEINMKIRAQEAAPGAPGRDDLERNLARLRAFQAEPDRPEDLARIPFLKRSDLPRDVQKIAMIDETLPGAIPFSAAPMFTNGIVYIDLAFRVDELPEDLLPYVPLLGEAVTGCGLPGKGYAEVQEELALKAGGFSAGASAGLNPGTGRSPAYLFFRLKALAAKVEPALELAFRLLGEADFSDRVRVRDILLEARNSLAANVIPGGSHFALLRAARSHAPALSLQESWEGISQLEFLTSLRKESGIDRLSAALAGLRDRLLENGPAAVNVTAEESLLKSLIAPLARLCGTLTRPRAAIGAARTTARGRSFPENEALLAPAGVGFSAEVMRSAPFGTREQVTETALAHLVARGFLHERLRVQGGAYGADAFTYRQEGVFCFDTFRDPRPAAALSVFAESLRGAERGEFTAPDVEKAVIAIVAKAEKPLRPGEKGYTAFHRKLYGIDDAMRQRNRDWLLGLKAADLKNRAGRLLGLLPNATAAVLMSREAWEKEKREHPEWRFTETEIVL